MNDFVNNVRDLSTEEFDTTTLLKNAAQQAEARNYNDVFIMDVDSHHYENSLLRRLPNISKTRRSSIWH